jgi:hypothetical protein
LSNPLLMLHSYSTPPRGVFKHEQYPNIQEPVS